MKPDNTFSLLGYKFHDVEIYHMLMLLKVRTSMAEKGLVGFVSVKGFALIVDAHLIISAYSVTSSEYFEV